MEPDEGASYGDALRERIKRARAELDVQTSHLLNLRLSVANSRQEASDRGDELQNLREHWTSQRQHREALLEETGQKERRLGELELQCAELMVAEQLRETPREAAVSDRGSTPLKAIEEEPPAAERTSRGDDARQRLSMLEDQRQKLGSGLQELRDAVQAEGVDIDQLRSRNENLRKESQALRVGAQAARESEGRMRKSLEGIEATASAGQNRRNALERQVSELRAEVSSLRGQLSAQTAAVEASAAVEAATAPPVAKGNGVQDSAVASSAAKGASLNSEDAATRETNRRLELKVQTLREELAVNERMVAQLRS